MSFIGRKNELEALEALLSRKLASLVVVRGRRRIGKSRLIEEFSKDYHFIELSGLVPTEHSTAQSQRDNIAAQMARIFQMPAPYSKNWGDLFWHLANQTKEGRVIILLDEISWMAYGDPNFLGELKIAWDLHFKKNPQLILFLCGSVSSWIEKNILSSTAFVGRIDLTLHLDELPLPECNQFWGNYIHNVSAYEKFKILSITGGVPRYLESIIPADTAENNIKRLCFTSEGLLFNEFEKIFNDLFQKRSKTYKELIQCFIKQPHATLNDVFNTLKITKSGTITEYLEDLIQSGFVKRDYTWSIKDGETSKLSTFRISDNYIRFYLKYILPNAVKITNKLFADRSITTLPGWDSIMGLQFENLVLKNRQAIHKLLHIDAAEILNEGPYIKRKSDQTGGCQIDYLVQSRFNSLYICEIKFYKNPIKANIVTQIQQKISHLEIPKRFSYRPVLIHVNGVDDEVIASEFFYKIIDFAELLKSA